MARKLVKLAIKETSGVDRPAHLHDGWVVMKSADESEGAAILDGLRSPEQSGAVQAESPEAVVVKESPEVVEEEVVKAELDTPEELAPETDVAKDAEATAVLESPDTVPSPQEEIQMSEEALDGEVVVIPVAATEDEIIKAMPATVKKILDDADAKASEALTKAAAAETALADERNARADEAAVIKAAAWSQLNQDPTVVGPALRRLTETDPVLAAEIVKALDSANSMLEANVVFTEVGTDAEPAADTAFSKMESLAKAAVASGTAPSYEAAIQAVAQANPDLYTQYLREGK